MTGLGPSNWPGSNNVAGQGTSAEAQRDSVRPEARGARRASQRVRLGRLRFCLPTAERSATGVAFEIAGVLMIAVPFIAGWKRVRGLGALRSEREAVLAAIATEALHEPQPIAGWSSWYARPEDSTLYEIQSEVGNLERRISKLEPPQGPFAPMFTIEPIVWRAQDWLLGGRPDEDEDEDVTDQQRGSGPRRARGRPARRRRGRRSSDVIAR